MSYPTRRPRWENDDLSMFRDAVRRFFAAEIVPNDARWMQQHHVDRSFWNKAGEMGLLCPSIPEAYGGSGGSFAHEAVVSEELAYIGCSSFGQVVHGTIVAHYLLAYGNEGQKQRWLPKLCTGEMVGAIAMSEPAAGSDLQGIRTRAVRDGEHYVLNGSKIFITNGSQADLVIVVVKTDPDAGAKGVSLIVVETAKTPGFSRGRVLDKIGLKGQDTSELFFEDARVPAENLLGGEGYGFIQLMQQLPQERLAIAVGAQAQMEYAISLTLAHVKERKVFGRALMDMQNTRFKLAECETLSRVTRAFVDECVEKHLGGNLSASEASMAKCWATDQVCRVVDECLQLHGGYGYMNEYPIARLYADVRVGRIYGGANEVMKELIARAL
ncbi:acyl-CoA dehydrogenase family protein [Noviherbaspirillum massiliense]|uniref:acyl-CoA dehydrogenase family protein n=1 Tax=Noviherbaspirillum massiliense TaxID=1465823 RepID=UPI0002EBA374|nr:acyl-CoA dehydrogenase family protein [Noviherbaspirillum massiliense]